MLRERTTTGVEVDKAAPGLTGKLEEDESMVRSEPKEAHDLLLRSLLQNGQVLVVGENTGTSAELYEPSTGKWTTTGSLNVARGAATATLLSNGQVLVAGGANYDHTPLASAELYTPSTGSLNIARYYHTATLLQNGQVLVVGGNSSDPSGYTASAELYTL